MSQPRTDDRTKVIAEAERLLANITPDDCHVQRMRYEHGGGRMYRAVPTPEQRYLGEEDRTLIIDAYNEGDREFYFAAASVVRQLLALVTETPRPDPETP